MRMTFTHNRMNQEPTVLNRLYKKQEIKSAQLQIFLKYRSETILSSLYTM